MFVFRQTAWLYFVGILCFVSVVLGRGVFWPVVGWGALSQVFTGFLGGLPEWGRFGNLGLGLGSPGCVQRSVSGSTMVLEGIV